MYGLQKFSEQEATNPFNLYQWFRKVQQYVTSRTKTTTVTTTYSVVADTYYVRADATSAGFTITLPTADGCAGRQITIKKIDSTANIVTVACTGAQTIDGAATKTISTQYISYTFICTGSNWEII